jgi:hypothetical protein
MHACLCPGGANDDKEEEEEKEGKKERRRKKDRKKERKKERCLFQEVTKMWHAVQNT